VQTVGNLPVRQERIQQALTEHFLKLVIQN